MKALLYTLGFLLYLNYRLFYFFTIYKAIYSFSEFTMRRDTDKIVGIILSIDVALISWYFFGWIWCLIILTTVTVLNYVVFLLKKWKGN